MGLNIKNPEVERLAAEVAEITGKSKTEVIRQSLIGYKAMLQGATVEERKDRALRLLGAHVWPKLKPEMRGKRLSKHEIEDMLGMGDAA